MANLHNLEQEIWKDIPGQEGFYQISSHGRVRSLDHYTFRAICKKDIHIKGRILKQSYTCDRYRQVTITGGNYRLTFGIHRMMWEVFKGVVPAGYEVDHIDNNKDNNFLSNLQLLKARHNSAKRSMNLKKTSAFTGVSWAKDKGKWQAHIRINGKSKYLGRYDNEIDASIAYQRALKSVS